MPVDGSLHGTANGHEPVVRGMEKYHRETGYTDRQGREELQADALCQKGDDGKNGSGKLSDPAEGRGDVH